MEAVVFPNVFKKVEPILQQGNILVMEGKVEERQGKMQFMVKQAKKWKQAIGKNNILRSTLFIKITTGQETVEKLQTIKGDIRAIFRN